MTEYNLNRGGGIYELVDSYAREQLNNLSSDSILNIANAKNGIARGKDITEYFTDGSLYTRISNGSFEDLFVGDYFKADYNGEETTFRIAGINVFYNRNPSPLLTNHIVVVPDSYIDSANTWKQMNLTNIIDGGYINSYINTEIIGSVATTGSTDNVNGNLYNIFGDHLLINREWFPNEFDSSGYIYQGQWYYVQAVLLSEIELLGSCICSLNGGNSSNEMSQLPLFKLIPKYIGMIYPGNDIISVGFWLRDNHGPDKFVYSYGRMSKPSLPTSANYIRPRFLIG